MELRPLMTPLLLRSLPALAPATVGFRRVNDWRKQDSTVHLWQQQKQSRTLGKGNGVHVASRDGAAAAAVAACVDSWNMGEDEFIESAQAR